MTSAPGGEGGSSSFHNFAWARMNPFKFPRLTRSAWTAILALGLCGIGPSAQASGRADKLYVIDCGEGHADDRSLWSPGIDAGKPVDMPNYCYLIQHGSDWLLWDTGLADSVNDQAQGVRVEPTKTTWVRKNKLIDQLRQLGLQPADIQWLAVSHTHPDHSGNIELFPRSMLLVQAAEYDWPAPDGRPRFLPAHPVKQLHGDEDVFRDGSVTILSTPGHTPGHQSLLVRLEKTGAVVLSGDAVHFQDNWIQRRVPRLNSSADATRNSMTRIAELLAREHAELWINHELSQGRTQRHAPQYYD
jgi:N-acyl homoserine lactone hydrolase